MSGRNTNEPESVFSGSENQESTDIQNDDESEDWILDQIQRQIDDRLQSDIERQLEEQLWKEMDEQLERQMDEQIQGELNQQFDHQMATQSGSSPENSRKIEGKGDLMLQDIPSKARIESLEAQNTELVASAFTINAQIQKAVEKYEGLNLELESPK